MKKLILALLFLILLPMHMFAQEVKSITVNGKTISVGDTYDSVLTKIPNKYMTSQSSPSTDPVNSNSFIVTKKYNVNGLKFDLIVGRREDPGPFRIRKIIKHAFACDKSAAREVDAKVRQMGTKKVANDKVYFNWGNDWNYADSNQKDKLIRAVADSDACLSGYPREIKFYSPKGKLVGVASPETGISVLP